MCLRKKLATMFAIAKLAKAKLAEAKLAKAMIAKAKLAKSKLAKGKACKGKACNTSAYKSKASNNKKACKTLFGVLAPVSFYSPAARSGVNMKHAAKVPYDTGARTPNSVLQAFLLWEALLL